MDTVFRKDTGRIDVRREPLMVRDGCAPGRIPAGRWPSDEALVRSEQFAVNEAIACLTDAGAVDGGRSGSGQVFGVHAPSGTGVTEVFGDLVAAIVTERAQRIADLADPAAAFTETRTWGAHTVAVPAPELAGFEIVLAAPEAASQGPARPGLALPPIGAGWRDRAARADYFASTARLADGIGAWAMLAARLGDRGVSRAFAERWWHGAIRGADVLFPAGESMAAALRRLKGTAVYWPACVTWFKSALSRAQKLADERAEVAAALTRLSLLEQACEEASGSVESARARLAALRAREPTAHEAVTEAEDEYRAALALLGAHELGRPVVATVTQAGMAALRSRGALSVAVAGGVRRGHHWRNWSAARRELRAACTSAERVWDTALHAAEVLRDDVGAARSAVSYHMAQVSRLASEMEPLATTVSAARERWGDCVPVGPSQAETDDPALIEWRETTAPWADEEYARARAEVFIAALELHKALIAAQADVFAANLAALMDLIATDHGDLAGGNDGAGKAGLADAGLTEVWLAAWRSLFLVVPVVQVPCEAAAWLLDGLQDGALGWLLTGDADQLAVDAVPELLRRFKRGVFAGDAMSGGRRAPGASDGAWEDEGPGGRATAQHLADQLARYGTWLPIQSFTGSEAASVAGTGPVPGAAGGQGFRWVGVPLRVVRGQDRATIEGRNEHGYDGLLITDRE